MPTRMSFNRSFPALPSSSSSSQLQLATGKTTVKRESPQLKVENLARASFCSTPKPLAPPTSISEWQLLAVLQRANLVQYYDMFISQGGDDINQIMQCDEGEFLEIMSLVGMLSKPLHVRRLQRALTEFSKDQTSFNLAAIQHIGPPPVSPYALSGPDMSFLMPGFAATLSNLSSTSPGLPSTSTETTSPQNGNATHNSVPLAIELSAAVLGTMATSVTISSGGSTGATDFGTTSTVPGGTANVVRGEFLPAFGQGPVTGEEKERSSSPVSVGGDFVSLGDYDPSTALCDSPVLSDAQIRRLSSCAMAICQKIPRLPPKLVQNKKRVSKEVLDLLSASADTPNRLAEYRKYSAIYGRFDAKRKPDKGLSFHEVSVNEAAAQLCLIMPSLLTRRDELFPLARQVVKDAGYHYAKASRKRGFDVVDSHSPQSSPTQR
ncbi:NAB region 2 protein [Ancylostoma caninum]|uniref:NAB region 2 protein n=1 Tax=Ancylostoma caninum TaxID=29170 RepID=A0A368GQD6_ANCCA|nr:NAB region 2 protein [Ancylostoma caninum]